MENSNLANIDTSQDDEAIVVYKYYWERIIYATITSMISVTGLIGNTLVIVAVFINKKLRNKTNAFVVNLAVADLISCLNLPWMALALLSEDEWPLPQWICTWEGMLLTISVGCSLYTLGGIALSRACLITLPNHRYHEILTRTTLAALVIIFWLIPIGVTFIPFAVSSTPFFGFNYRYSMCIWNTFHFFSLIYNVILAVSFYPIPLIIIFVSYFRIWWFVRVNSRRMARITAGAATSSQVGSVSGGVAGASRRSVFSERQMSVTKNLLCIIVVFLILISPYTVLLVLNGGERLVPSFGIIFLFNSCVNPFIYGTRHPDFKVAFGRILRLGFRSRRTNQLRDLSTSSDSHTMVRNKQEARSGTVNPIAVSPH